MKVIADVIDAADGPKITLLSLLDMSAAFDTVDHAILLRRLELSYSIGGTAHQWLTSFLSDRTQVVAFAGQKSSSQCFLCGVPQGSVFGPLLLLLLLLQMKRLK